MDKFLRFLVSGIFTYTISIGITYIGKQIFVLSSEVSYFITIILLTSLNFFISLYFTFKNQYKHTILLKYILGLIIFGVLNYLSVILGIKTLGESYLYSIIFIVTTVIFFIKFIVYNHFIFNHPSKK